MAGTMTVGDVVMVPLPGLFLYLDIFRYRHVQRGRGGG